MTQSNTALATVSSHDLAPRSIDDVRALAQDIAKSKLFGIQSAEAALVIILTGHELGLTPMQSCRNIYTIEGKPVLSADLIVALCRTHPDCEYFTFKHNDAKSASWVTKRKSASEPIEMGFTWDDAVRADLTNKPNWKRYPADMLSARACARLGRRVYQERLMGFYLADEIEPTNHVAPVVRQVPAARPTPTEASYEAPQLPAAERSEALRLMDEIDACRTQEEYNRIGAANAEAVKRQRITTEEGRAVGAALTSLRQARGFLTLKEQQAQLAAKPEPIDAEVSPAPPAVEAAQ